MTTAERDALVKPWIGAVVLLVSLLSCDRTMPTESTPGADSAMPVTSIADAILLPIADAPPGFVDIDTIDVVTPPSGVAQQDVDLGTVTAASGAISVLIEGSFAMDSVPIPVGEIINGGGMLYFEQAMNLLMAETRQGARQPFPHPNAVPPPMPGYGTSIERKGVRFEFNLVSDSAGEQIERTVIPQLVESSSNSVRLLLDSTARGRLTLRWSINTGGAGYSPDEYPDECLPIHERCTPFPPASRVWVIEVFDDVPKASGAGRVIVQRREGAVVRLRVSRDTVLPVFAQHFNADSQTTSGVARVRRDTVVVTIPGVPGADSPERKVRLFSVPEHQSGGHWHNNSDVVRPKGTFFLLNQLGSISIGTAGSTDTITINRPVGRDTSIVYRTSGIGGVDWIRLRAVGGGSPRDLDSVSVTVRLAGLDSIVDESDHFFFFVPSTNHRFYDRFLQPGVLQAIDSAWGLYKNVPVNQRAQYPMTNRGRGFQVDAMSLPNGGLHDIFGTWGPSNHQYHREGLDVDFNDLAAENPDTVPGQLQSPQDRVRSACRDVEYSIAGESFPINCDPHCNNRACTTIHFHAYMVPTARRNALLPWRK